jgi:hypothetical protein
VTSAKPGPGGAFLFFESLLQDLLRLRWLEAV